MSYLRAAWSSGAPSNYTLEDALVDTLGRMPAVENTIVPLREGHAAICVRDVTNRGLFIHVAAWTDRRPAASVPHVMHQETAVQLGLVSPGADWEYLAGDGHLLVWGNHCIMLPSGLHPKSLERFMQKLLTQARPLRHTYELVAIADPEMVRRVVSEGVKKIDLHIGQYQASASSMGLLPELQGGIISRLFKTELTGDALMEASNLNVKLSVAIDGRRRGKITAQELAPLAQQIAEERHDEYMDLVTAKNYRVKRGDLVFRKSVDLNEHGNTVRRREAWILMDEYLEELSQEGALDH